MRKIPLVLCCLLVAAHAHPAETMVNKGTVLFGGQASYGKMSRTVDSKLLFGTAKWGVFVADRSALLAEVGYGRIMYDANQSVAKTSDQYIKSGIYLDHFWQKDRASVFYRAGLGIFGEYTSIDYLCGGISPRIGVLVPCGEKSAIDMELGYSRLLAGPARTGDAGTVYLSVGLTGFFQ